MDEQLLKYFSNDEFCAEVWKSKYGAKSEVTPDDMHKRMAKEFAKIRFKKDKSKSLEEWGLYFYLMFKDFHGIIPQGRVMSGLGVDDSYRSLSNCLRLPPPKDSYSSIMYVDTMLISAAKRGCGYGVGLSKLRPTGAVTTNAAHTSSGLTGFGNRYSNSTHEVGQKGRRGACLEDLDIRHPDSPYWAIVKLDKTLLTGANISFKIWNDFMEAMLKNEDYILRFPVDFDIKRVGKEFIELMKYNELTTWIAEDKFYLKKVKAKELWDASIHTVWSDGCPGLQFWERIINYDPASVYEKYQIDGTNACGEQPKAVGDTCRLLAYNLLKSVKNAFKKDAKIDYDILYQDSYEQLVLGDDLIDLEIIYVNRIIDKIKSDPEPEKEKAIELELWEMVLDMAKSGRRIGCGITALGDMIAAVGLKYDSKEALELVDSVMYTKMEAEYTATIDLAKKYGTFIGWDKYLQWEFDENDKPIKGKNDFYEFLLQTYPDLVLLECQYGRRNVNWSTIAPTGTLSIIAKIQNFPNVSSGCEPSFFPWYFRNKKVTDNEEFDYTDEVGIKWKTYPVIMGAFKAWMNVNSNELNVTGIKFENLSEEQLKSIFEKSPWFGATANEISWEKRVEMQSILQKYTTSAISSTVNLPSDAKEEIISDIYIAAWKAGLKGITCYRDTSKGGVLVNEKKNNEQFIYKSASKRPKEIDADLHIVSVKGIKYNVIVGLIDKNPYEIFAFKANEETIKNGNLKGKIVKSKKGHYNFLNCIEDNSIKELQVLAEKGEEQVLSRLCSGMLRHGAKPEFVMEQIDKCELEVVSFGKAISRILKKYVKEEDLIARALCSDCGSTNLRMQEGCLTCNQCGSSKCS